MHDPRRLFIVVPVHDRKQLTANCLMSLREQTSQNFSVIVVDDGSTDGTAEMISNRFPKVIVLQGDGNLWWTGATNLGIQYALERLGTNDFILLLNNDITFRPNFIDVILQSAADNPGALVGSVAVSDDDQSTIIDGGVRINWRTAKYTPLAAGVNYQTALKRGIHVEAVDVLSGRGVLVPVEVFHKVGSFDQRHLPHYGADYEFSVRAGRAGFALLVDYRSVVLVNDKTTGLRNNGGPIRWGDLGKSYFSKRSPYNIRYRWNFARLACPRPLFPTFFIFDTARVLIGSIRNQFM